MADISTNSLGRTQQAGQGTAFIYEPMSKTKPLDKLYNSILQEKARKDKMKVEQDKLKQKSGEDLRDMILTANSKIRMQDMVLAQKYIDEIMTYANNNADWDNPNSSSFIEISKMLSNLGTFANASQSYKEIEMKNLANMKDFDVEDAERWSNNPLKADILTIQDEIAKGNPLYNLTIAPKMYTPEEVFKKTGFTQSIQNSAKMYKTVLYNAKTVEEQNAILDQLGYDAVISGVQNLKNMQNEGRLSSKLTDDDLLEISINHVTPLIQTTLYDPTKTNQLNLNWAKLNETIRKNNRDFAFKKDKFSWEQKQAEKDITEFRVDKIFEDAGKGGHNSLETIKSVLEDGEKFEVISGADLMKNNKKGFLGLGGKSEARTHFPDGTPINEKTNYFAYTTKEGKTIYGDASNPEIVMKYASNVLGKRIETFISKDKTGAGLNYAPDNTQPNTVVGKQYQTKAGTTEKSGSSTTTTNNKKNKLTKSGLPIF